MKATDLINKFKQILLSVTPDVVEETPIVEDTVEDTVEETVELSENNTEEVIETEVNEEEVIETEEEVIEEDSTELSTEEVVEEVEETEEVIESEEEVIETEETEEEEIELSTEDNTEVEETTELAEETTDEDSKEEEIVEEIQEAKEEVKYASAEELAGLKAEISALTEMLNNMNPKKDVPQELSAEDIKEEQDTAEGISVSPEAEVVSQPRPLAIKSGLKNASTKDVVWNKLFGN